MLLRKETGGCSITYERAGYAWEKDGDITEVPYDLGVELLAISGGGFGIVDTPTAREAKAVAAKAKADAAEAGKTADPDAGDGKDGPAGDAAGA